MLSSSWTSYGPHFYGVDCGGLPIGPRAQQRWPNGYPRATTSCQGAENVVLSIMENIAFSKAKV
jgi:hypothetical protein